MSPGQRLLYTLLGIVLVAGILFAVSQAGHEGKPVGVWSPEHGHYHSMDSGNLGFGDLGIGDLKTFKSKILIHQITNKKRRSGTEFGPLRRRVCCLPTSPDP